MLRVLVVVFVGFVIASCNVNPRLPNPTVVPLPPGEPLIFESGATIRRDIPYCTPDGVPLLMDLYFPPAPNDNPLPLLVFVSQSEMDKALVRFAELQELLARGYSIASLNVRQPPRHKFPRAVEDAQCAVRYLRANAQRYNLDSNRIGAWGCSLGGYLSAMLGVTELGDKQEYTEQSSRVRAVVVEDVIADMREYVAGSYELNYLFGITAFDDPILARSSPVSFLSHDDSPFLIFASDSDSGFWSGQAKSLHDGLQSVGVPTAYIPVTHAQHCWDTYGNPSATDIAKLIADFFDQQLK